MRTTTVRLTGEQADAAVMALEQRADYLRGLARITATDDGEAILDADAALCDATADIIRPAAET